MSHYHTLAEQLAKLLATIRVVEQQADNGEMFADVDPELQRTCDAFDAMWFAASEAEKILLQLQSKRGAIITLVQDDTQPSGLTVALSAIGEFNPEQNRAQSIASSLIAELGVYGVQQIERNIVEPRA